MRLPRHSGARWPGRASGRTYDDPDRSSCPDATQRYKSRRLATCQPQRRVSEQVLLGNPTPLTGGRVSSHSAPQLPHLRQVQAGLRAPEQRREAPADRSGAQRGLAPDRGAGAHRGTEGTETTHGAVRVVGLTSRLDAKQTAYRCEDCGANCINPRSHVLTRARVCTGCLRAYLRAEEER